MRRGGLRRRLVGLMGDTNGQAMTEYVILSAVTVLVAAWVYHPDNTIFQGIRMVHDRTEMVIAKPGP
jgi:hypothetical protein